MLGEQRVVTPIETIKAALKAATPGPWKAIEHKAVSNNDYIQILSGSWDIAHNKFSARSWEEEQANAHLIANAPTWIGELLEDAARWRAVEEAITEWGQPLMRDDNDRRYLFWDGRKLYRGDTPAAAVDDALVAAKGDGRDQ